MRLRRCSENILACTVPKWRRAATNCRCSASGDPRSRCFRQVTPMSTASTSPEFITLHWRPTGWSRPSRELRRGGARRRARGAPGWKGGGAAGAAPLVKERAGLNGGRRIALDPQGTASIKTWISTPLKLEPSRSQYVERIDHLGIASADNRRGVEAGTGRIGRPLESQQTDMEVSIAVESFTSDKYAVVYHTRAREPIGGLRVSFITVGDCELEFLQNFDARHSAYVGASQAGTTRQDQGAITKFIAP